MTIFKQLNFIFSRNQKIKFLMLLSLTFGGAIAETFSITMIMPFIAVATNQEYIFEQEILLYFYSFLNFESTSSFLMFLSSILIVAYIIKTVYLIIMYRLQCRFVYNNQTKLSVKLMDCYLKKKYEYITSKNSAEIIQGVTQDVTHLCQFVLYFIHLITEIMIILCMGIVLIIIDPVMVILTIFSISAIMCLIVYFYRKSLKSAGRENQRSYRDMIKWINQGIGGIKEIKVIKREQFFINKYTISAKKYAEVQSRHSFINQIPKLLIECVCMVVILITLTTFLYRGLDISAMIPQLATFAMAAFRIMPSFNKIALNYNGIIFRVPSVDKVYKELKSSEGYKDFEIEKNEENEEIVLNKSEIIKVKSLYYKYPNTKIYILEDAEFEIPIKKSTALVGVSGAGKTTFADIFLGLLYPNKGEITVNGINIHNNLNEWSKKLGYIPQNIYICDDTIKRNVAFGIEEFEIDDEKVIKSLKKAQLYEFIKSLPKGVNTEIGEHGVRLSGGQRQRIGIARAFYNDPEIFVFDEATSALDNDTEAAVMEAINTIKGEKTLIIIAHRLSTIQNCDVIYRAENGKFVNN